EHRVSGDQLRGIRLSAGSSSQDCHRASAGVVCGDPAACDFLLFWCLQRQCLSAGAENRLNQPCRTTPVVRMADFPTRLSQNERGIQRITSAGYVMRGVNLGLLALAMFSVPAFA